MIYRQGDILLKQVPALLKGCKPNLDCVLARGEATGHAHVVSGGVVFRDPESERLFVRVTRGTATVVHDEHAPITLAPGIYEVVGQREYTADEIRRVSD